MLTVRTGNTSPFGRKIRIAVNVLGLEREVAIAPASTVDPADPIRQQNPLGKVPVLILDDGAALYDSPVILEYLDHRAGGGRILPKDTQARFAALRLQGQQATLLGDAHVSSARPSPNTPATLDKPFGKSEIDASSPRNRASSNSAAF